MRYFTIFLSTALICLSVSTIKIVAQSKITGTVLGEDTKPIAGAEILLLRAKDSGLIKGTVTNTAGSYLLEEIPAGTFLVSSGAVGFINQFSAIFSVAKSPVKIPTITLSPDSKNLKGVTVSAKKPMFEQKIDRMVINVKSSITSAGGTVLEVLEKSPGVIVNRASGSVSLNGKDGVMVMINGKMNYMPPDAILQMLNATNASSVERIELITTPPAKYDAGGNAGYINIVMADNPNEGFNGNYYLSMGVGKGTLPKAGINFNYRKKAINIYGAYNFSRPAQLQTFKNYRKVTNAGGTDEVFIVSNRDPYSANHDARLGVDYKLNKKTILGVLVSGYNTKWVMDAVNNSQSKHNGMPDTSITIENSEVNHWKNVIANFNLMHTIKDGEAFAFNTDFLYYHDDNPTTYLNKYYDKGGNNLFNENTSSSKETVIKIWASQVDYNKKLNEKTNVQSGIKASFSRFTNDVLVQKMVGNTWWADPAFTANYFLKENIMAAYASMDEVINKKTNLKAGLRYEYTTSNLGSETKKNIVDRKYGKLFPSIFLRHKINENNGLNFSYSKRINRPAFTQLAPFLIFFDPKTFISGNSSLQPSITDAVKIDWLLKQIVFSVSYSHEKNTISRFQTEVDTVNNIQITTPQNMEYSKLLYVSVSLPIKIRPWWFSQLNLATNWNKIKLNYKKEPVEFTQIYYTVSGAESFTLPKKYTIELSGFFQSKGFFGANKIAAFGNLNIALQKKFKNSSLTFGVDNVLNTMKFSTDFSLPEEHFETTGLFEFSPRLFKLSWSCNFGNKVLKDKRARTTASEDERQRVQN